MRILIVQPTCDKRGHYGIWTVKMCQALGRKGHEVTLCTNKVYPTKYIQEKPIFRIFEVDDGKYSFEKFDKVVNKLPFYYYYGYFRNSYVIPLSALKLSKIDTFDVIFISDTEFMLASILLKKYRGHIPPVVMQVNAANFSFSKYPGSIFKKMYKVIQREIFKKTLGKEIKAIAVLGGWHKERLRSQLDLEESFPVAVIPDGGGEPQEIVDKVAARKRIGIDYDGQIFLFFGMIRKDKGIEQLLEAVSYLENEDFKVLIAGSLFDVPENNLKNIIHRLGITEKVILRLMYIPDDLVSLYFSSCDALILPYPKVYAGGSGPLMKGACTYSRPAIVSDVSEMGRLAKQHKIGLVAEAENPHSLAEKMKEFISLSEKDRKIMAENAFNLAKGNSWDVMAERFTELYEKISGDNFY